MLLWLVGYAVDPLWCFRHANRLNSRQLPFNECLQKSNYLVRHEQRYDALLLGSSRLTSFNQLDVAGYHAFNNAVSGMLSTELGEYAEFAKRHNTVPFKVIIVGLDFFSTNENFSGFGNREPGSFFADAENPWFKLSHLLTWNALSYSLRNIRLNYIQSDDRPYYDRHNILTVPVVSKAMREANVIRDLAVFKNTIYGQSYRYRELGNTFRALVAQNPDSHFIVFTTPESVRLWRMLIKAGLLDAYLQWLTTIVNEFGAVYTFMGDNELTANPDNFIDGHHVYPHVGKQILSRVLNLPDSSLITAGTLLDRATIDSYRKNMYARYGTINTHAR